MPTKANGAVLDNNGAPIAGPYAAGSTIGGLDGALHAGYVGGLIKAVIALRAAEKMGAA
jgi:predicted oxidoreductase